MNDSEDLTGRVVAVALKWLQEPAYRWQVGAIVVMGAAAWLAARALATFFKPGEREFGPTALVAVSLARRTRFLVLLGLGCIAAAGVLLRLGLPHRVAWIVALLAFALAAIRILIGILKRVMRPGPLLAASEQLITWTAWLLVALYVLGWTDTIAAALDSFQIPIGEGGFSLLQALNAALTLIVFLVTGAWLGAVATRSLMRDGVDTLIPNENVISNEVVNWSYSDRAVRLKLPVQISYGDNPRTALALLLKAADGHSRVLKHPTPASRVMGFDENGISLELRFWIQDPEDGIKMPFPQRGLHLRSGWPAPPR